MFNIGLSYNFSTLAPAILGATYTNMKVIGILTMDEAIKYYDVVTRHEALKGIIPGLPVTPNNMTFILFQNAAGDKIVLAQNYIDPNTIVAVTTLNLQIDIFNVPSTTEAQVTQALKELGITNFRVTVV